jgi:Spy/CpxP family protein refolding chaperone
VILRNSRLGQFGKLRVPTVVSLIREFASEQKQMNAISTEGGYDPVGIGAIANSQAVTLAKLLVEKEKLVPTIYTNVLTPEQRIKADRWRQQLPSRLNEIADQIAHMSGDASGNTAH